LAKQKISLCLDATVDSFARQLSEYTRSHPLKFPVGYSDGYHVLQPIPFPDHKIGQRPLTLKMTRPHVPQSAGTTTSPSGEFCAISFKIEPLPPSSPWRIEVTAEYNDYLQPVLDYFEQLLEFIGDCWSSRRGGPGIKRARATIAKMQAITGRMGYQSGLKLKAIATFQDLDRSLDDFHSTPPGQKWAWETVPTIGKTLHTRLKVRSYGPSCRGDQIWVVQALDVSSDSSDGELGTPFCIVTAAPSPGYSTESETVLDLNFWPDWNQEPTPQSYPEYLKSLLTVFQERGLIEQPPSWLTALKRTEPPPPTGGDVDKPRAGRPPIADDDWAYREIRSGRDQTQVYKEWLERIPKSRRTQLADPLDSFKKAISYRADREKREKRE
jgi:hypothetical protein